MVAPSFVIVTSYHKIKNNKNNIKLILKVLDLFTPISSTNILSKPSGPNELFTILANDAAAITIENEKNRIKRNNFFF